MLVAHIFRWLCVIVWLCTRALPLQMIVLRMILIAATKPQRLTVTHQFVNQHYCDSQPVLNENVDEVNANNVVFLFWKYTLLHTVALLFFYSLHLRHIDVCM